MVNDYSLRPKDSLPHTPTRGRNSKKPSARKKITRRSRTVENVDQNETGQDSLNLRSSRANGRENKQNHSGDTSLDRPAKKAKLLKENVEAVNMDTNESENHGVNEATLKKLLGSFKPTIVPEELPCRFDEVRKIRSFIDGNLKSGSSGCMYISGVPGTGKTASVRVALQRLDAEKRKGTVARFESIELNAMFLSDPKRIFVEFYKNLLRQNKKQQFFDVDGSRKKSNFRVSPAFAVKKLDRLFETEDDDRPAIVLLLDELDALVTKRQEHLYRIFDWTTQRTAKLTIIAIANTLDLPERMLSSRNNSRMGLHRLCFEPYNHHQIEEILISRFGHYPDAVEKDGIILISRKVAAVSGDVRRAIELCRIAIEIALSTLHEFENFDQTKVDNGRRKSERVKHVNAQVGRVTLDCANNAIKQIATNVKVQAMRHASTHEKLLLEATVIEQNRLGLEGLPADNIWLQYQKLCREKEIEELTVDGMLDAINRLADCRLLARIATCSYGAADFTASYRLNVDPGDVKIALNL